MLQWNPQVVRSGGEYEQTSDELFSYMFPYSAYTSVDMGNMSSQPSQDGHHQSHSMQSQPPSYDHNPNHLQYSSYPGQISYPSEHSYVAEQYHQSAGPSEYFNLPQQSYPPSNRTSSVSVSPMPTTSTHFTGNEPQIRLSANMFRQDSGRYVPVSLDPRRVSR